MSSIAPDPAWLPLLADLFKQAENAGWGIAKGASFEAFPGLEDAATDYIQSLVDKMGDPTAT